MGVADPQRTGGRTPSQNMQLQIAAVWRKQTKSDSAFYQITLVFVCSQHHLYKTALNCLSLSDGVSADGHRVVDADVINYVTATKADTSVIQCNVSSRNGYVYTNIAFTVIGQ